MFCGNRSTACARASPKSRLSDSSVGSLSRYIRPDNRIFPSIISGRAAKYSLMENTSPLSLVCSATSFHDGPVGASPGRSFRSITMSVVTSVPALRLKVSLGRRIAPSNSVCVESRASSPHKPVELRALKLTGVPLRLPEVFCLHLMSYLCLRKSQGWIDCGGICDRYLSHGEAVSPLMSGNFG